MTCYQTYKCLGLDSRSVADGASEYAQNGEGENNGRLRISVSTPNTGHGPLTVRGAGPNGYRTFICGTDTNQIYDPNSNIEYTCDNGLEPQQVIWQRIYHKNADGSMSYYDREAGTMTYHPTHGHNHTNDWGVFTLRKKMITNLIQEIGLLYLMVQNWDFA